MSTDDPKIVNLAAKPPRSPHVIAVAEALSKISETADVYAVVVAWSSASGGIAFSSFGPDDSIIGLCERTKFLTMCGGNELETPSDE